MSRRVKKARDFAWQVALQFGLLMQVGWIGVSLGSQVQISGFDRITLREFIVGEFAAVTMAAIVGLCAFVAAYAFGIAVLQVRHYWRIRSDVA